MSAVSYLRAAILISSATWNQQLRYCQYERALQRFKEQTGQWWRRVAIQLTTAIVSNSMPQKWEIAGSKKRYCSQLLTKSNHDGIDLKQHAWSCHWYEVLKVLLDDCQSCIPERDAKNCNRTQSAFGRALTVPCIAVKPRFPEWPFIRILFAFCTSSSSS